MALHEEVRAYMFSSPDEIRIDLLEEAIEKRAVFYQNANNPSISEFFTKNPALNSASLFIFMIAAIQEKETNAFFKRELEIFSSYHTHPAILHKKITSSPFLAKLLSSDKDIALLKDHYDGDVLFVIDKHHFPYRLPFENAMDIIKNKRMYQFDKSSYCPLLLDGYVYFNRFYLHGALLSIFKIMLRTSMNKMEIELCDPSSEKYYGNNTDERIRRMIDMVHNKHVFKTLEDVCGDFKPLEKERLPPCMKKIILDLEEKKEFKFDSRTALYLFSAKSKILPDSIYKLTVGYKEDQKTDITRLYHPSSKYSAFSCSSMCSKALCPFQNNINPTRACATTHPLKQNLNWSRNPTPVDYYINRSSPLLDSLLSGISPEDLF